MALYSFGSGTLWGVPASGNDPTPVRFGTLQNVAIEFATTTKPLYGGGQFPLAIARAQGRLTGKAQMGRISARLFAELFFGQALIPGRTTTADNEPAAIPASPGPYTVGAANAAGFQADLGVIDAATGLPLAKVAANPAQGQYAVAQGVYSFAAADAGKVVLISYTYAGTGSGGSVTLINPGAGAAPLFSATFEQAWNGRKAVLTLNSCVSSKLAFATKAEDWSIPEFDFEACADPAGNLGTMNFDEVS